MTDVYDFIKHLQWEDLPNEVQTMTKHCLVDTLGVAISAVNTNLAKIAKNIAVSQFGANQQSFCGLLGFEAWASATGVAMAGGFLIDAVDGHDGHKITKGHAGASIFPALCAMVGDLHAKGTYISGKEFLTTLLIGYEVALRTGINLHQSTSEYHTSGAWTCVGVAAMGARLWNFSHEQTTEAFGIADYHGPRSPMMRCIDHPSMLKDGAGWGAMSGTSAVYLALQGFTGAPAYTITKPNEQDYLARYEVLQQYFKPWPVCRWAHPAIQAVVNVLEHHTLDPTRIVSVEIATFHQAVRLGNNLPLNEEQAQYAIGFPVATLLAHGKCSVAQVTGDALNHPLSKIIQSKITLIENPEYSKVFPAKRFASVTISMDDGTHFTEKDIEALGDPDQPMSEAQIMQKFHDFTNHIISHRQAQQLIDCITHLDQKQDAMSLLNSICGRRLNK